MSRRLTFDPTLLIFRPTRIVLSPSLQRRWWMTIFFYAYVYKYTSIIISDCDCEWFGWFPLTLIQAPPSVHPILPLAVTSNSGLVSPHPIYFCTVQNIVHFFLQCRIVFLRHQRYFRRMQNLPNACVPKCTRLYQSVPKCTNVFHPTEIFQRSALSELM